MSPIPESEFNDAMNEHGVEVCSSAAASARYQETILGAGLGVSRGVLHELLARQGPQWRARPDDGDLRERLKALAQERRRFGYRRLQVLLRHEGRLRDTLLNETLLRSLPHARAVRSKLGWMTPRDYARALSEESGRHAANPDISARRPLAAPADQGSDQPRTLVMAG